MDLVRKLSGWPNGRGSERRVFYRIGRWLAAGLIGSGLAWHFGPEMWLLLTLTIRAPTVFVVAAIGAGVLWLAVAVALIFGLLAGLFALFLRYQTDLLRWIDRTTLQHVAIKTTEKSGKVRSEE